MKLILAQGNPGIDYALSRHNVGFAVLDTLADKLDATWINKPKFQALTTNITIGKENDRLLWTPCGLPEWPF
jgi:PTH1 family peptidyl-tRNA hydrolase